MVEAGSDLRGVEVLARLRLQADVDPIVVALDVHRGDELLILPGHLGQLDRDAGSALPNAISSHVRTLLPVRTAWSCCIMAS